MTHDRPTFGSLFAGIGGFDLGLERAGWSGRWQVELDPFCRRVLERHWPDVERYGDIREVDWSGVEPVDLVCGGFPCQPVSNAGRRRAQADPRWLWPEFARCIRALQPRLVLVENVTGILVGDTMGDVLGELAALGYDAEWTVIPAAAVGAPHRRDRVWILAYADGVGSGRPAALGSSSLAGSRPGDTRAEPDRADHRAAELADADSGRRDRLATSDSSAGTLDLESRHDAARRGADRGRDHVRADPSAAVELADADVEGSQGHGRFDLTRDRPGQWSTRASGRAVNSWWVAEPGLGRLANGVPGRVDRLRALGNAVVPQVVELIGRTILESAYAPPARRSPVRAGRRA